MRRSAATPLQQLSNSRARSQINAPRELDAQRNENTNNHKRRVPASCWFSLRRCQMNRDESLELITGYTLRRSSRNSVEGMREDARI